MPGSHDARCGAVCMQGQPSVHMVRMPRMAHMATLVGRPAATTLTHLVTNFWEEREMKSMTMTRNVSLCLAAFLASVAMTSTPVVAAPQQPNIIVIMSDDVGWENIGAYHQGLMYSVTPNLDRLAAEGMRFTDYYAEPSCTAGRANFITGELPIRTGLTTVGQAGSKVGMPADAVTIATTLKSMGYATGQFGKNHLGDLNEFLPTVHGFDEFFGYLYHL